MTYIQPRLELLIFVNKELHLSFEEILPVQNGLEVRLPSASMIKIMILLMTSPVGQTCQAWLNGLVV